MNKVFVTSNATSALSNNHYQNYLDYQPRRVVKTSLLALEARIRLTPPSNASEGFLIGCKPCRKSTQPPRHKNTDDENTDDFLR
jgi:hypothetical protein